SFPGTLAYLTGAHPATTGVYYDDSYDRTLFPPGTTKAQIVAGTVKPGTETQYAENLDYNSDFIGGGSATPGADGTAAASSITPATLRVDANGTPVYPSSFLKVNTVFNVARAAGDTTAFSDKHPAYEIANGPGWNGKTGAASNGVQEFYSPEVNSLAALEALTGPSAGHTVDAKVLLAMT